MSARHLGAVVLLVAAASCHRTPEEPTPAASTSTTTTSTGQGAVTGAASPTGAAAAPKSCPPDPEPGLAPLPSAAVTLPEATGGAAKVDVEIARNDHDTERGLMYRTSMAEDHGMLFELDRNDHPFWMHNTCIPLDLVYIDGGVIVGIIDSAPILDDQPRSVGRLSDRVLEVNAGWCRRHGVRTGQRVVLPAAPR